MSVFGDVSSQAASVWFDSDIMAEAAVLNGGAISICVLDRGTEMDDDAIYDYLDTDIQSADYATVTYRTDVLVYGGISWRYPIVKNTDIICVTVRWIANQKPRIGR